MLLIFGIVKEFWVQSLNNINIGNKGFNPWILFCLSNLGLLSSSHNTFIPYARNIVSMRFYSTCALLLVTEELFNTF